MGRPHTLDAAWCAHQLWSFFILWPSPCTPDREGAFSHYLHRATNFKFPTYFSTCLAHRTEQHQRQRSHRGLTLHFAEAFFPSPSASVLYARGICVVLLPLLLVFPVSTLLTFHLCNNKQGKLLHQVTVSEAPWIMCWQIVDKDTTPPPARAAHSSACHSQSSVRLLTTKIVSHFFWCRYKRQSKKDTRLPCFMLRTSTASSAFLYIVSCSTWGNKEQKQQQQVRKNVVAGVAAVVIV